MKFKFLQAYEVKDGTGTSYDVGQVVDFNENSANHFLNRGVVVPYTVKKKTKKKSSAK